MAKKGLPAIFPSPRLTRWRHRNRGGDRGRDRPRPRAFIKRDNLRQEILYLNFPSVDRSSGQKNRLPSLGFGTGGQKGYDQTLKLE